jgi:DNA-binding transcriptional ArsR family regulator
MQDTLSITLAALADPTRRAMLLRLAEGTASVTELGRDIPLSQPAISKHIKVLEKAGLISRSRSAQFRPCQLEPAPLREVATLMGAFRQLTEERFDRLENYLNELQNISSPGSDSKPSRTSRKGKKP